MIPLEELKPCRHAYEYGLCLELMQPTRLTALAIPKNQPGIAAAVPFWIRLSNNTSEPVPFGIYGTLIPELVKADGRVLKPREPVGRQIRTGEHDCYVLMEGKWQSSISLNTKLRWHDNVLQLWVPALPDNFQVPLKRENYWISAFIPTLIMPDGQIIRFESYASDWLAPPGESDFSLAMPGEAVTFFPSAFIYRVNDRFWLYISVGNGGWWSFDALHSGTYQIQLEYENYDPVEKVYDYGSQKYKPIENIWTGMVTMPPMEFSLVYP